MIYLDHNATTPLRPEIRNVLSEFIKSETIPLNPSSPHFAGRKARSILNDSRQYLAELLGFHDCTLKYQIFFTSGATEANNMLLNSFDDGDSEIFISSIEHPSIFQRSLAKNNITLIKVDENGILDLDDLESKLHNSNAERKLLSVVLANNETGVIQNLSPIVKIARKYSAFVHSDIVQAIGKMHFDLVKSDLDYISLSGHKFGAPSGSGALIAKSQAPISSLLLGGQQQMNKRAGTENILGIFGLGQAAKLTMNRLNDDIQHMKNLQNQLESTIVSLGDHIHIVSDSVARLPNTSFVVNKKKNRDILLSALDMHNIAVSTASACSAGVTKPSRILIAMGYAEKDAQSALRFSVGLSNTTEEIEQFLSVYAKCQ